MSSIATASNIQRGMAAPAFGPLMWRLYLQTEVCQSSSEALEERRAPMRAVSPRGEEPQHFDLAAPKDTRAPVVGVCQQHATKGGRLSGLRQGHVVATRVREQARREDFVHMKLERIEQILADLSMVREQLRALLRAAKARPTRSAAVCPCIEHLTLTKGRG